MTSHNTHKRQTSKAGAGFEPAIPLMERPQTHSLDRAVTAVGYSKMQATAYKIVMFCV